MVGFEWHLFLSLEVALNFALTEGQGLAIVGARSPEQAREPLGRESARRLFSTPLKDL